MKISVKLFAFGCFISILSSSFIVFTYILKRERRRHPATLVASRSVCDLALALLWFVTSLDFPLNCSSFQGQFSAFLIEFFVIASELLLACLSFDVLIHAGNPFVDYRANLFRYYVLVFLLSLGFASALVMGNDDIVGESFLPICWTAYRGGRVISHTNVSMIFFFYLPWFVCFLLSLAGLGRASVILDLNVSRQEGEDARISALRDTRRVILSHASYWGLILLFFAPLTNRENDTDKLWDRHDVVDEVLRCIVLFLSGARALENVLIWLPQTKIVAATTTRGEMDLQPILNIQMQREILHAAVTGMASLLESEEESTVVISMSTDTTETTPFTKSHFNLERRYLVYSVSPILIACASSSVVALVDKKEPTYVSLVFLGLLVSIIMVLFFSSRGAHKERGKIKFQEESKKKFQQLRDLWKTSSLDIAHSLRDCLLDEETRFGMSSGKSGSFLFFSRDGRFVVKTIEATEKHVLCHELLDELIVYLAELDYPSALAKCFACFEMRYCYVNEKSIFLVVMENVNQGTFHTDTRYDLKGSWLNRSARMPRANTLCICQVCNRPFEYLNEHDAMCLLAHDSGGAHRPRMLFKDNDFRERILGNSSCIKRIRAQLSKDTLFLAERGIMDYSLLVSVQRKLTTLHPTDSNAMMGVDSSTRRRFLASLIESPSAVQFGLVDWFTLFSTRKYVEFLFKYYVCWMKERDAQGFLGFSALSPREYRERFLVRVVDMVFPLLCRIVQLVEADQSQTTPLDVNAVHTFAELQRIVHLNLSHRQRRIQALCLVHADLPLPLLINEASFNLFLKRVDELELCTVMVVEEEEDE